MKTVTTINLAGRSYTLEESGYETLKAYLDQAAKNLEHNPDKEEILKDFDLAVAEKCEKFLNTQKNVITAEEVNDIIKEMGPVENTAEDKTASANDRKAENDRSRPKKLYRLRDGGVVCGVCAGLAAYFDIDVLIIRILFVGLTILTHGAWILVYFIMVMFVPIANTPAEKSMAFGGISMTAQELLQKAREGYGNFKNSKDWKNWKRQLKEERNYWKYKYRRDQHYSPASELIHSFIGIAWLAFFIYISWLGYHHVPIVHQVFDQIGMALQNLLTKIDAKFIH